MTSEQYDLSTTEGRVERGVYDEAVDPFITEEQRAHVDQASHGEVTVEDAKLAFDGLRDQVGVAFLRIASLPPEESEREAARLTDILEDLHQKLEELNG